MEREVKRIPLDFDYPLHKVWYGYQIVFCHEDYEGGCERCREFARVMGIPMVEYACAPGEPCPDWKKYFKVDPPKGEGWQLWGTTSEGEPRSPVFKTPEELADWCSENDTVFANIKATKLFLAGKAFAVVALPLQNTPEPFHRAVVNTLGHTGHTLRHASFLQFVVEGAAGILKAPVAMEKGVRTGIGLYRTVKGLENQRIVISVANHIGNNAPVIEVEDCAEIDIVNLNTLIPFELSNISEPFLVGLVRMEITVKKIFGHILRFLCLPRTAVVIVFADRQQGG